MGTLTFSTNNYVAIYIWSQYSHDKYKLIMLRCKKEMKKQATAKAEWATFSTNTWLNC